ncbi:MAG: S8 family serine peptidase, partial [Actinobacteria bacterium]|nr:S8 family serine peptidase [Actinomycetota bacterium]
VAALLLPLVACGGDSESPTSGSALASIQIRPAAASVNALGATQEFSAEGRDGSGSPMPGVSFTWTSSATDIATVDASGVATAVGNGTATIRARADGVTGSTTLTVRQEVAAVILTGRELLDAIGDTARFETAPVDAHSNPVGGRTVEWTSSDEDVATIDASGVVTAVADGSTRIKATVDGVADSTTLTVSQTGTFLRVTTQPSDAAAGQPLGTQPVVTVTDALGNPVAGDDTTEVTAAIASGGGTLVGSLVGTAADGVVTFTDLGLEGTVGDRVLSFNSAGLQTARSDPFTLEPGPPVALALDGGDGQTAPAATTLPQPLSVSVSDAFGNGVGGTTVGWFVDSGSGSLASAESVSDGQGVARVDYTLGRFAGDESVTASVGGLSGSPVTFTATATPNATISGVISLSNQLLAVAQWDLASSAVEGSGASRSGFGGGAARATKTYGFEARSGRSGTGVPDRGSARGPEYTPDELLVTFRSPALSAPGMRSAAHASRAVASRTASSMRATLFSHVRATGARVSGVLPAVLTARVTVDDPTDLEPVAARLRSDPAVARVERNPVLRLDETAHRVGDPRHVYGAPAPSELTDPVAAVEPDDPLLPWQAWHYAMIDGPEAWRESTGSGGVIVAVVDDGIQFDHPGISANLTGDGYDFVSNGTSLSFCSGGSIGRAGDGDGVDADPTQPLHVVYDEAMGCISGMRSSGNHGLHVAGTVGAVGNDGGGGTGLAWNVSIRPVRVIDIRGSATHFDVAQGVLYAAGLPADDGSGGMVQAASGAPIINMSLGGPSTTATLVDAIIAARDAGSLIVASAGNAGTSDPRYPAAYPQTLSVSAVGPDWQLASYSSFGSTVDIAAPGGDHADAPPGNPTYGVFSTAWDYESGTPGTPIWDGSIWNGTSMAAP